MADDLLDEGQPAAAPGEPWQAPRVTRFAAARASLGSNVSGSDAETDKS